MFALFFDLYLAMFRGVWSDFSLGDSFYLLRSSFNKLGEFITSIFGDFQVTDLGETLFASTSYAGQTIPNYLSVSAFFLALITSIGIVVMAAKGVKKAFGIFFGHIR